MLKIDYYRDLEEALEASMTKDYDHTLIRHSYPKGRRIYPHTHDAYEWVIATHGHFKAESEGEELEF